MPNLHFYAADEDWAAVLEAVFALGSVRVFEAYSEPDRQLLELHSVPQVLACPRGWMLRLYAEGSGPEPVRRRIDLHPGALGDATFRYTIDGWGLVELHHGGPACATSTASGSTRSPVSARLRSSWA